MENIRGYAYGHPILIILGLLYIVLGLIQVLTLGIIHFQHIPDWIDVANKLNNK